MQPATRFIFDGTHLLYRAAYRTGHVPGQGSKAAWGLPCVADALREIHSVLAKYSPNSAYVVFDGGRSERRLKLYPGYKEGREHDDIDRAGLRDCMLTLTSFLKKLSVRVIALPGREADDVIGVLVQEFKGGTIVSNDRDFLQLVKHGAGVYLLGTGTFVQAMFFHEFTNGLTPDQFLLVRAIAGDDSDNIAGVPGVGVGTATDLIKRFEGITSLAQLRSHVETIPKPKKRLLTLMASWDLVERNLQLMDLSQEVFSSGEIEAILRSSKREVMVDTTVVDDLSRQGLTRLVSLFPSWSRPFYFLS